MAQYQKIVELDGDAATEALDAYWHGGGHEVYDVLTNHDEGGEGEVSEVSWASSDDEVLRLGDYNVIVNPEEGYAILEVVVS